MSEISHLPAVLTAPEVAALAAAVPDSRVQSLAASHERLREMFAEATTRIAKQSDALTAKAETAAPGELFGGDGQDMGALKR